ncbi:hypothetical protein BHE74_00032038, partial [Ensete ventricosum]
ATAGARDHMRYCTLWPLDAAPTARGCLLMRLRSVACGRPACDRHCCMCAHSELSQADPAKTQRDCYVFSTMHNNHQDRSQVND